MTIGGGGGFTSNPDCTKFPGGECGGAHVGWINVRGLDGGYNPYSYDTIGISNALRDSFPCIYAYIRDSFPNANYIAQLAGTNIFKDSAYFHLMYDTSAINTSAGQPSGQTTITLQNDINGKLHCVATIRLNEYYLRNSAKEYNLSTILHETMHAIVSLRFHQYTQWLSNHNANNIDSNFIKNRYPLFWDNWVVNGIPPGFDAGHEIMMTDYRNYFTSILSPFYNSAAPPAIRDTMLRAMGYGGLRKTTAWKLLGKEGKDTCKYKYLNATAQDKLIGTVGYSGCPIFTTHWSDSCYLSPPCY